MRTSMRLSLPLAVAALALGVVVFAFSAGETSGATLIQASPRVNRPVLDLLYQFSGVTDDGAKGAATRKEATSILCTNFAPASSQIEVQLYQWSGALIYTATVTAAPNASYTFSTQNTSIYFDDVIFGSGGGTDSIFQGAGQVWTDSNRVICTAEVLDPLNYPPFFMLSLPLYDSAGNLIGHNRPMSDLVLVKKASPAIAGPGDSIQYTLTYSNTGVFHAENVLITDGITSSALSGFSFNSSGAVITPTGTLPYTWQVAELFPGEGGVITVTGTVDIPLTTADFSINNTATITATEDLTSTNNTSSAQVHVHIPRQHLPIIRR